MIALGLFYVTGAQAVHDETFQLDGNVLASVTPPPANDWDSLFDSAGATKSPLPTGFDAASFKKDFNNSGTTFQTNDTTTYATGSKDTLPISTGWQCNFDNNVNSKIDVMNAYAATYTDPTGDEIIYFAIERNANTGTADVGFWFLQGNVGCSSTGGAANFTGDHQDGDLLVVSEFTGGGTVSTVNVYRWDGGANGSLNPVPVASGADCRGGNVDPDDEACGAANTVAITTPWLTAAKTLNPNVGNNLPIAQFYEGGINLTDSGLGGKCFNTFIGDTRSSTSLTATLFDFAGGQLGACTSGVVTTPQVQTSAGPPPVFGSIPGAALNIPTAASNQTITVRDRAVITVSGATSFGGTVTFSLCGPLALNSTSNCQSGGVQIGSAVNVVGASGTATVDSASATLTSVGRYCWRAVYSGDAGVGVPGSTDPANATNTSECFSVNPITPTLTTQASCSANPCVLGSTLSDTANLTGTARQPGSNGIGPGGTINATNGALAGGSISFTAFGPNSCSTTALATTTRAISGDGTYPTAAQAAVSFAPAAVGEYIFVASYDGSSPNTNAQPGDTCANQPAAEKVTVTGAASLSTAQRWLPNDTATITSPAGTTLAGNVQFTLYNDGSCGSGGGTSQYASGLIDVTTGTGSANNRVVSTSNTSFLVTASNDATAWSWKVSYNDNALEDPADKCETTTPAFTLTD